MDKARLEKTMQSGIKAYIKLIHQQNLVWNTIPSHYYSDYNVKRGLRNADGTGVLAGLTTIGEVHGYVLDEGNKAPVPGKLRYRGIDVEDIIANCQKEKRFGFEETTFLLMFGFLPDKDSLEAFSKTLARCRELPSGFTEDIIFKAPSKNIVTACKLRKRSQNHPNECTFAGAYSKAREWASKSAYPFYPAKP